MRSSYKAGHRPKYLCIVDETPECGRALRYGARRAVRIGGELLLCAIIPELEAGEWLGVHETMTAHLRADLQTRMAQAVADVTASTDILPQTLILQGNRARTIRELVDKDTDIAVLVLAAGNGPEGPGPLISQLVQHHAAQFPIPITIVPGDLSDEALDALT